MAPAPMSPAALKKRSRLARTTRAHGPSDPATIEARREFDVQRLEDHIRSVVSTWPPLTEPTLDRLSALLRTVQPT